MQNKFKLIFLIPMVLVAIFSAIRWFDSPSTDNFPAKEHPFEVTWPDGWSISEEPLPYTSGHQIDIIMLDGNARAIISLGYIPLNDYPNTSLDNEFSSELSSIRDGFAVENINIEITTSDATISGHQAKNANIIMKTVPHQEGVIVKSLSSTHIYTISYIAPIDIFSKYKPEFDKFLENMTLH